jgi:hypothetical protein
MPRKKTSLFKVRKPRVRLTTKGVRITKPSTRIGSKTGINISSKGVSFSSRGKLGTASTRRGRSTGLFSFLDGCGSILLVSILATVLLCVLIQ